MRDVTPYFEISPDGKYLAYVSMDRNGVQINEIASGKKVRFLKLKKRIASFASPRLRYSPGGKKIAVVYSVANSSHSILEVRCAEKGNLVFRKKLAAGDGAFAFSRNGKLLAMSSNNTEEWAIRIWNADTGKLEKKLKIPLVEKKYFAENLAEPFEKIGKRSVERTYSPAVIKELCFSNRDKKIIGLGNYENIIEWNLETGKSKVRNPGTVSIAHTPNSNPFYRFSKTGRYAAVSTNSGIRIWDVEKGKEKLLLKRDLWSESQVDFTSDEKAIAIFRDFESHDIEIVNLENRKTVKRIKKNGGSRLTQIRISPTGNHLFAMSSRLHVWNMTTGRQLPYLQGHEPICRVKFLADNQRIVSMGFDGIRAWNFDHKEELFWMPRKRNNSGFGRVGIGFQLIESGAFSPKNPALIIPNDSFFWDRKKRQFEPRHSIDIIKFSNRTRVKHIDRKESEIYCDFLKDGHAIVLLAEYEPGSTIWKKPCQIMLYDLVSGRRSKYLTSSDKFYFEPFSWKFVFSPLNRDVLVFSPYPGYSEKSKKKTICESSRWNIQENTKNNDIRIEIGLCSGSARPFAFREIVCSLQLVWLCVWRRRGVRQG